MSKQTEALKLALEAAEGIASCDWRKWEELASPEEFERWVKSRAIHMATALREALAEQQEWVADVGLLEYKGNSVAYIHQKMKAYRNGIDAAWDAMRAKGVHPDGKTSLADMTAKHISSQPSKPWVGLTDEEITVIASTPCAVVGSYVHTFARAIEAKLRENNA